MNNMADVGKTQVEHIESRARVSGNALENQQTLEEVDVGNHQAFKGNDSDGKTERPIGKLLASAFLSMLYTSMTLAMTVGRTRNADNT